MGEGGQQFIILQAYSRMPATSFRLPNLLLFLPRSTSSDPALPPPLSYHIFRSAFRPNDLPIVMRDPDWTTASLPDVITFS